MREAIVHHRPELEPKKTSRLHPAIALLLLLLACYAASFLSNEAYRRGLQGPFLNLKKPVLAPPLWLFTPACTILFGMIGFAAWLVWRSYEAPMRSRALGFFGLQLVLSVLWAALLFGWVRLPAALLVSILAEVTLIPVTIMFARISRPAAWLLVPYLLWVMFNSVLTLGYERSNTAPGNPPGVIETPSAPQAK